MNIWLARSTEAFNPLFIKILASDKLANEFLNHYQKFPILFIGNQKSYSAIFLSRLCKMIANVDNKRVVLSNFRFDSNLKF